MKNEELPQKHQAQYSTNIPVEADIPIDAELRLRAVSANRTALPLMHFAWPILIENIIRVGMTSVDVFMLSSYATEAVAATGLINQFVFFINLLYLMVASGASILISQNLGAGRAAEAGRVAQGSVVLAAVFAVLLSAALCLAASNIVGAYSLDPLVHEYAVQYMVIYSAGSLSVALCMTLSTIIRSYGHSRGPMIVNGACMVINVIGNYILIFGRFGAPALGVRGAALSTVASQIAACAMLYIMLRRRRDIALERGGIFRVPARVYRQILAVGVPTAGENVSYNLGQILIMRFISTLGTEAMTAFVYAVTVLRFVFITSISIGSAAQIKVGYFVGAGMADIAQRKVYRYFGLGVVISVCLVAAAKLFEAPILQIFRPGAEVCQMAFGVLAVALIHEPGRNFNVIIIPALKGAGDVRFPVYVGMAFMWGVGVVLAYVFGIVLGWGLLGICAAMAVDEWSRGIVIFFRWRGGRWKTKSLVK